MTTPEPEHPIRRCAGGVTKKRRYTPKAKWDHIRKQVTEEVRNGTPHLSIIAELKRKDVHIELYQFRRLLREWKLSDKNIKQKNRKYIFQMERCARERGKVIRGWWFGDPNNNGRRVKQTQLNRILQSDGKEFENVEASPGNLVPSPMDIFTPSQTHSEAFISTPPGQMLDAYADDEQDADAEGELEIPAVYSEQAVDISEESPAEGSQRVTVDGKAEAPTDLSKPTPPQSFEEEDPTAGLSGLSDTTGQSDTDGTPQSQDGIVDPSEFLQSLCDDIIQSMDTPKESKVSTLNEAGFELLTPKQLAEHLSEVFRPNLDKWMKGLIEASEHFIKDTDRLVLESKIPRSEAEKLVSANSYTWAEDAPPSYKAAAYIKTGTPRPNETKIKPMVGKILPVFYDRLFQLWETIGSENATFKDSTGKPNFVPIWRLATRRCLVHLPYLAQTYGYTHFTTLMALTDFIDFVIIYGVDSKEISEFMEIAETITKTLQCPTFSLTASMDDIAQRLVFRGAYNDALKISTRGFNISQKEYGNANLHTITAAATLAEINYELSNKNSVETLRKYIAIHIQSVEPLEVKSLEDCTVGVYGVIIIMTTQLLLGDPRDALKTGRLIEGAVSRMIEERQQVRSAEETARAAAVCVRFQYLKAKAYFQQQNYWKSLEVMQEGIHAFPGIFPSLEDSTYLINLATKAMTDRGLVRYTEPVLEKLLRVYEEKNNPEQNPFYHSILFAAGSATFQLYLQQDEWNICQLYPTRARIEASAVC
ncbi:hypothetical protein TWF281_007547 [Arthrobotrys megalospora]